MIHTCFECGTTECIQRHHVVPRIRGGTKTIPLCVKCHAKVHDKKSMASGALISEGIKKQQKQGRWFGRPPYGYKLDASKKGLVPRLQEKSILDLVLEKFPKHTWGTYTQISKFLNENGYTTRHKKPWTPTNASQIFGRYYLEDK